MNPLQNYNHNTNFWEFNPQFKESFKDVYTKDKSKDKSISSNLMWFLAFSCEERKNIYSNLAEDERIDVLANERNITLNDETQKLLDRYRELRLEYTTRKLRNWRKKLDERDEFMGNTKYEAKTYVMLDTMMGTTDKLWKQYFAIENEINKTNDTTELGGEEVSLTDKGMI